MTYGSPLSCENHTVENAGFTNLSTFDGFGHKGKKEEKKAQPLISIWVMPITAFSLLRSAGIALSWKKKNMKKNVTTAARKTPKK